MTNMDELTQGLEQLRDCITRTAEVAPQVARREVKREGKIYFRAAVVASVITSVLIGAPLALLANRLFTHEQTDQQNAALFQAETQTNRQLAQSAHDLGVQANAELARHGVQPVLIPAPGTASDFQVLTAATQAEVAAKVARNSSASLTPAQIQAAIAAALAKLPPAPAGPAAEQLAAAVQGYLAANPQGMRGPSGAKGDQGLPGAPPMSWTVQESDGSSTTCERVTGFDPAAPRYRCSHATAPASSAGVPSTRSGGSQPH